MDKPIMINVFGGPGAGKCFAKDTKILMYDGDIKAVQDIIVGDKLMGDDSTPRTVLSLDSGVSDMYDIVPVKGEKFTVTSNHILTLKYKHHGPWEDIECTVKDYLMFSKTKQERSKLFRAAIDFKNREFDLEPYFIGCWLGDGRNADQSITIGNDEILAYMYDYADRLNMQLHRNNKKEKTANSYYLTNGQRGGKANYILNGLRELNLLNNKHIPDAYKINSREVRLELLAGLIDTDGDLSRNCFGITTKYKKLAEDIMYLCRSLGLACYYSPCEKSCIRRDGSKSTGTYFRLSISGELSEIPVRMKYKQAKIRKQIKDVLHTGFDINEAGNQEYYGFETDGNHKFLLADFTVTHNSTTAASVFGLLKLHGVNSELITEFAKDLTWENRAKTLDNQYYVWAKQYHRLWRIGKQAKVVVTDAPLLHSLIYGETSYEFKKVVMQNHNEFNNRNYYLIRVKDYEEAGRSQTEEQAKGLDEAVFLMLRDNNIEFTLAEGSYKGVNVIVSHILKELDIDREYYISDEDPLAKD